MPNAVRMSLVWQLTDGKIARNVLGAIVPAGFTATATLAEAARAAIVAGGNWTAYAAFLATTTSLLRVELLDIRQPQLTPVSSTGAATLGTSASTALPSEVAAVMTLKTGKTGPANRGRVYWPGLATNAQAAGDTIAAATMTALNNMQVQIGNAMTAIGASWGLVQPARASYTGITGTVHPSRAAGIVPITAASIRDNHWDSQRRRGLK